MKILYAAGNTLNSKVTLWRFYQSIKNSSHQIKIAAYKKSSPKINIDWTLDALLNPERQNLLSLNNDNVHIYYEQIKAFNPDLIISDLEYFTSYIANLLDITLWNCSSLLINYSLSHKTKYNAGVTNQYSYLLGLDTENHQKIMNIIHNANLNLVYSHFGDVSDQVSLKDNFKWCRPFFSTGKQYAPCQHNMVASMLKNDYRIVSELKTYKDSVIFSEFPNETHDNIIMKSIWESEDYYCNIFNSEYFICGGQTNFLADAYYNNKKSFIIVNYEDMESITNSLYSKHLKTGTIVSSLEDLSDDRVLTSKFDPSIFQLHQLIEDL